MDDFLLPAPFEMIYGKIRVKPSEAEQWEEGEEEMMMLDLVGSKVCNLFAHLESWQDSVRVLAGQAWTGGCHC